MPRKSKKNDIPMWIKKHKSELRKEHQMEKQAENNFVKFFWLLIFTVLVIITVFSLVERSRLETVILIAGIAICGLLYKIGGKS